MPNVYETGPYLIGAVLCEKVLTEQDGVLSLIRVVDKITSTATGPEVPDQMPPTNINLSLVIMLKAGRARGRHMITVRIEDPSGARLQENQVPVSFSGGEDAGANLIAAFNMVATLEGLYWVDVLLGGQLLTRVPLRIEYRPMRIAAQGLSGG